MYVTGLQSFLKKNVSQFEGGDELRNATQACVGIWQN